MQRAVHAGFGVLALRIADQLFGLARTIILARVLAPNDFGLMGIALLSMATLETFSQSGFQQALIHNERRPRVLPRIFLVLLQAFTNVGGVYFLKELEFNEEFMYQFTGTLADFVVAISSVLILRSVWGLVLGLLAGNAARRSVSYLIHPYRSHLSSDIKKAKELFGLGKWILGSSILTFLLIQGDDIFVGNYLV